MELYLQFGYGMMGHSRYLVKKWGRGTVILSPRDLNDDQLRNLACDIRKLGGGVLLDPQFYLPHADHERLVSHEYWPLDYDSGQFWSGEDLTRLLGILCALNVDLGTELFILPGLFAIQIDDDWLFAHRSVLDEAQRLGFEDRYLCATVSLSAEAVRTEGQIERLIDDVAGWNCDTVYLVCEHPNGEYLVSDPSWLMGVSDLVAGFRLASKHVVVGYCNHQMLLLGAFGANAISSGTWMNVRSFPPEKFRTAYDDEIRRRGIWYYSPDCLSEFTIPYLDIARKQGILDLLEPSIDVDLSHSEALFSGIQPTTVEFSEQQAFRHYLECLYTQVVSIDLASFDAAKNGQHLLLEEAERRLSRLHSAGVRGQRRDFIDAIDANRAALDVVESTRGSMLRRRWDSLVA